MAVIRRRNRVDGVASRTHHRRQNRKRTGRVLGGGRDVIPNSNSTRGTFDRTVTDKRFNAQLMHVLNIE